MKICIFGAASYEIDQLYVEAVEKMGEIMAKRGHSLVFGAGRNGLMGAAARGFQRAGANVCGVIPEFFREKYIEQIYNECDEIIFTQTMSQRKAKMEELADAFIIVPGGIGTLEEFFEVLTLKQLGRHTKPIAIYDINGYYKKLEELLDFSVGERFVDEKCKQLYKYDTDIDRIIEYIEEDERIKHDVHELKKG